ncbi:MAG: hypothetical protein ACTSU7_06420, partial [Candidatus Heimdallarchaeaceae archaeon]
MKKALRESGEDYNISDLIVLTLDNGPYYVGSKTHIRKAKFFSRIAEQVHSRRTKFHNRAVHYTALSNNETVQVRGENVPYGSTDSHSASIVDDGSKYARYLGYVPYDWITD